MQNKYLYAVLLGGKLRKNNLIEDHNIVFVVAKNEREARQLAKKKWEAEALHIDGTQRVDVVDGYQVQLVEVKKEGDEFDINPSYST